MFQIDDPKHRTVLLTAVATFGAVELLAIYAFVDSGGSAEGGEIVTMAVTTALLVAAPVAVIAGYLAFKRISK